ncbi:hypothetical protein EBQ90_08085 [bacterium]|nr:hypothetical protein [bacterium]
MKRIIHSHPFLSLWFLVLNTLPALGTHQVISYVFDSLGYSEAHTQKRMLCELRENQVVIETTLEGISLRKEITVTWENGTWNTLGTLVDDVLKTPLTPLGGFNQQFRTKIAVLNASGEETVLRETGPQFVISRKTSHLGRLGRVLVHACHIAGYPGTMSETFADIDL